MTASRRSVVAAALVALAGVGCSTSRVAQGFGLMAAPRDAGTGHHGPEASAPTLPIEQQLAAAEQPTALDQLGELPTEPSGLTGEAAALRIIPPTTGQAPVLRRRLPPDRLLIPKIGVDAKVVQLGTRLDASGETVWETAAFAVGHHRGTANPGEPGNVVLSGHISSVAEGDVFRRLPEVATGDAVVIETAEQPFLYVVRAITVVEPTEVSVMGSTNQPVCTLITCVPDGVYTHRLVVSAALV